MMLRTFFNKTFLLPLLISFSIVGCTKMCGKSLSSLTPEEVVEAYLDVALNMTSVDQKEDLLKYTTGPLHEAIAQVSNDVIKRAYIDKNYYLESYSVVERKDRTPRETEITFKLVYKESAEGDRIKLEETPLISTENTVSVTRQNQVWQIRNVLNKRSSFDFPLASAPTIRPGVDA